MSTNKAADMLLNALGIGFDITGIASFAEVKQERDKAVRALMFARQVGDKNEINYAQSYLDERNCDLDVLMMVTK